MPGGRQQHKCWGLFESPVDVLVADDIDQVPELLALLEKEVGEGKFAAGFISYEAAPAFDKAHKVKELTEFPLMWFGIYEKAPKMYAPNFPSINEMAQIDSIPELTEDEYISAVRKIEKYIGDGDIYQANFTFRSKICFSGKPDFDAAIPYHFFASLFRSHPVPYAAYVNTGKEELVSISPELFLERSASVIRSMPMKGTAHRRLSAADDLRAAEELSMDPKNRAENIMIVDMVRNDFGRICRLGSVKAGPLWHVDTYNTVHQMISCVEGELPKNISLFEVFAATFPAASITGAPKIRAMQIIDELERTPRKVYTGSIGCIVPGGDFVFNVAIRTLIFRAGDVELGAGSGIVADSDAVDEWQESLLKGRFISRKLPDFELLETMLWTKAEGVVYLNEHLERLRNSYRYFLWNWNQEKIINVLNQAIEETPAANSARLRLLASQDGNVAVEIFPLDHKGWGKDVITIKLAEAKTDSADLFLYHKTTNRIFYNQQFKQALAEGFDEVIFTNEKNEITEGAISNIFIRKGDNWFTPPVRCGLLPGIWRAAKFADLHAEEKILYLEELKNSDEILVGNSVRGEVRAKLSL